MPPRNEVFIKLTLFFVSVAIAAVYYTGLYCSDDTRYLMGAIRIAVGEQISVESLAERRAVFLLPASVVYAFTQSIDLSIAIYASFYAALAVLIYMLARRFFEAPAAFCTALIGLSQPTLFLYSGALLPDISAAFFIALSMLFLVRLSILRTSVELSGIGILLGLACGSSVAVAFAIKESSIVVAPIIATTMAVGLWRQRSVNGWAIPGAALFGFSGVVLLEVLLFKAVAGEWYSSFNSLLNPHDFSGFADVQGTTFVSRLGSLYGQLGHFTALLFILAAASSCKVIYDWSSGSLRAPNLGAWLVVIAFWAWPTFYFTFGTASLTDYSFPVMQQRYYAPCVPPAALLAGRLLAPLLRASAPIALRVLSTLAIVALVSAPIVKLPERGLIYGAAAKESFRAALHIVSSQYPNVRVVDTDSGWTTDLNRCRILLLSNVGTGRQRLMDTIRSGADLDARFKYSDVRTLDTPFILLGHGTVLDRSKGWVKSLDQRVDSHDVRLEFLGQHDVNSCPAIQKYWFLPRSVAAQKCLEGGNASTLGRVNKSSPNSVSAYRVSGGDLQGDEEGRR